MNSSSNCLKKARSIGVVIVLPFWLFACATAQRVPLVNPNDGHASAQITTVYFFDEDPDKARIVRELALPKK